MAKHTWSALPSELLRFEAGFKLADLDRSSTPGWDGGEKSAQKFMKKHTKDFGDLQERLFANGKMGLQRSILLIMQGMDSAGKGGITRHVLGLVDPQGVSLASFGVPTAEEKEHDFLWRIRKKLPPAGKIGVFDRSHYEEVLVVKVNELEPAEVNETRYAQLVEFDEALVDAGTTVIKVALMHSHEEQGRRFKERLVRPDKHWKYSDSDLPTRLKWDAYQDAFQEMFERTSTEKAPWFVVPANNKWYAQLAVAELLYQALDELDLSWPPATYNPAQEIVALAKTVRAGEKVFTKEEISKIAELDPPLAATLAAEE